MKRHFFKQRLTQPPYNFVNSFVFRHSVTDEEVGVREKLKRPYALQHENATLASRQRFPRAFL
jgi:hypothetical protein